MEKFEAGKTYMTRSAGDHNCIFKYEVVKRTAKMITIKTRMRGERRVKIQIDSEGEFCFPDGRYSMAPVIRPKNTKELKPDWM